MSNTNTPLFQNFPNIFLCGLSGSGKDTFVNELTKRGSFVKIRLAETIKRMVTELNNISFEELETLKRTVPELRSQHNEFDLMMREFTEDPSEMSSANRCRMIIKRKTMDFTNPVVDGIDNILQTAPMIIIDGRAVSETLEFIEAGFVGVFLTRTNSEFRNPEHETEADNISNGTIRHLCELGWADNIYIINNDNHIRNDLKELKHDFPELFVNNIGRVDIEEYKTEVNKLIDSLILYYANKQS